MPTAFGEVTFEEDEKRQKSEERSDTGTRHLTKEVQLVNPAVNVDYNYQTVGKKIDETEKN
jgi:hypothetical protein